MKYTLRFAPEVEADVVAGYKWYEGKSSRLGEEFLGEFYTCIDEIDTNPELNPKVYGEFRRRLLKRFPYVIYFRVRKTDIIVVGLFHCARDPGSIRDRVLKRDITGE